MSRCRCMEMLKPLLFRDWRVIRLTEKTGHIVCLKCEAYWVTRGKYRHRVPLSKEAEDKT